MLAWLLSCQTQCLGELKKLPGEPGSALPGAQVASRLWRWLPEYKRRP